VVNLIGTYECKADAKGRLMLPSSYKKQLSEIMPKGFVLKRSVFQNCLELYPRSEWDALMQKMNKLNRFKKKNNDFIRRFTAGVKEIEVDATGRILIPYEQAIDQATDDFADLAEEVMGDDFIDGE